MFGLHSLDYKVMIFTVSFSPALVWVASHVLHIQEVGRKGRKWNGILLFILGHWNMINSLLTHRTNAIWPVVGSPNHQDAQRNKSWNSYPSAPWKKTAHGPHSTITIPGRVACWWLNIEAIWRGHHYPCWYKWWCWRFAEACSAVNSQDSICVALPFAHH